MPQNKLNASNLTLSEVEQQFSLCQNWDSSFFLEWQQGLTAVDLDEQRWLDQIKRDFLEMMKYPMHEEIVKMVVLSPLLMFAGLLRRPFLPVAERQIEISLEDGDGEDQVIVRGRIDVLILCERFWVSVIETKCNGFNVIQALPQALVYMMNGLEAEQPRFGLITNGSEFRFVKLLKGERLEYGLSDLLTLQKNENELFRVVQVLRELGQISMKLAERAA